MSENKIGKYFKYAIGEILLVVIGILIALQINNWNENDKNKGYEKQYLARIQSDIKQDLAELKRHFKTDTLNLDTHTYLNRFFNSDTINANPKIVLSHFYNIGKLNWFEGKNVVFDDMKSSGKTSLIASDSLRDKIQNYYRLFEEVIKQESLHNGSIKAYLDKTSLVLEYGPFIEIVFPKRWNAYYGQITQIDLYNKLNNLEEHKKKILVENYSSIKAQIAYNSLIRSKLYEKGMDLSKSIDDYLTEK